MNAKKEAQTIQGTKQEFLKIFREMCYSRSAWQWRRMFFLLGKTGQKKHEEKEQGGERFYMVFDFNDKEEKRWEKT